MEPSSARTETAPYYYFSRSPRFVIPFPEETIEIPEPPQEPAEPANSLLYSLIPMAITVVALVVVSLVANMQTLLYFSVPLMLSSAVGSWFIYRKQKQDYQKKTEDRSSKYKDLLKVYRSQIQEAYREQIDVRKRKDPGPSDCLRTAQTRSTELWSRSPSDPDFLSIRVGLGDLPATVEIKVPSSNNAIAPDPLIEEAIHLARPYQMLEQVPLCVDLRENGVVGVAGERPQVLEAVFALVLQIATHHAPNEVKLSAIFPAEESGAWGWMRWLPHVWDDDRRIRYMASQPVEAMELFKQFELILDERRRFIEESIGTDMSPQLPYYVLFVGDSDIAGNSPLIHRIQTEGPSLGILPIFLSSRSSVLPQFCRAIVRLRPGESFVRLAYPVSMDYTLLADRVLPKELLDFARSLAPTRLRLSGTRAIPESVALLDLFNVTNVEELKIAERWERSRETHQSLTAPIGMTIGNQLQLLDLHERSDGPNGLVAGMVGAGKSELLQTFVAALAVNYPPDKLGFVLADYKGGSMTRPFKDMPHEFGIITDLEQANLAARAIRSFDVELDRRKDLFNQYNVSHIDQYQKLFYSGKAKTPLPYLVVIVDEFAEMKTEQPETAQEFVRIARTGRAFGLRLILAMQKPAGIVDGQIEANTRFRLCLRVAQTEDSQAMLKRPDAAFLKGIGRAYLQVGANEVFREFQVGYGGAPYDPERRSEMGPNAIVQIDLNGKRRVLLDPSDMEASTEDKGENSPEEKNSEPKSQLQAVVAELSNTPHGIADAVLEEMRLWLPPLSDRIVLSEIVADSILVSSSEETKNAIDTWLLPTLGVVDNPAKKSQDPLTIPLAEGHLAIYGAPGYGKSTVLQTLIVSLSTQHPPSEVAIYVVDFGGQLLQQQFGKMPHVRGVVNSDEEERLDRLFFMLRKEIQLRRRILGEAGVSTFAQYRAGKANGEPAIVLVIDKFDSLSQAYQDREEIIELFTRIAQEGVGLGIHFVLTSSIYSGVRYSIANNISHALALFLIEKSEYGAIVGRLEEYPIAVPGRCLIRGNPALECQIALPIHGEADKERSDNLKYYSEVQAQKWGDTKDRQILTMPEDLVITDLFEAQGDPSRLAVPLGLRDIDLSLFRASLLDSHIYLILGSFRTGKSTLIRSWIISLNHYFSSQEVEVWVFDSRSRSLADLSDIAIVKAYAANQDTASTTFSDLESIIDSRVRSVSSQGPGIIPKPHLVVVIDNITDENITDKNRGYPSADLHSRFAKLISNGHLVGATFLVAGNTGDIYANHTETIRQLKEAQTGFTLGAVDDRGVFQVGFPRRETNVAYPPGVGFFVNRKQVEKIKVGRPPGKESDGE